MRLHALQHVPFEGLGLIEHWAREKKFDISRTLLFKDESLPPLESFDSLVVMGGPMGAYDEDAFRWLKPEKEFIRKSLEAGKKVLGICLGCQLLAEVIGGRVFPGPEPEIGWFPVESLGPNRYFPPQFTPLHWHGDTFELPVDAVVLASTSCYRNQAFSYGENCLGIQFHLELTAGDVRTLAEHDAGVKKKRTYVQAPEEILSRKEHFGEAAALLSRLLDAYFL